MSQENTQQRATAGNGRGRGGAEALRRRNHELSILNTIAAALNQTVDLSQALSATLSQVAELLDLQTGWIWLLNETTGESYLAAAQNLPPGLTNDPHRMEGSCYCLDTFRAGDLSGAANINVVTCSRLKALVGGTGGLRYHASIPLYAHDKRLGVLNVASPDWRGLSPDDLRLLHTIGDLLSIAIERARLFERSAQLGAAEERNRLAREIHDTLAQGMAAVALQLETADALLDRDAERDRVQRALTRALELTRANLEEARRSVLDLRAAPLEGKSLAQALAALATEQSIPRSTRVTFSATGGSRPLSARTEVGVFGVVREAVQNALRHAHARHVRIALVTTPDVVRCTVTDDGQGFDPEHVPAGRFGLIGMSERARLLGGRFCIDSQPGQGTRIDLEVPLNALSPLTENGERPA